MSLEPDTTPSLFNAIGLGDLMRSEIIDIRNAADVRQAVEACAPEIVFHLAAQPLVRKSYSDPICSQPTMSGRR